MNFNQQTNFDWSETILNFNGIKDAITFESYRAELVPPCDSKITPI